MCIICIDFDRRAMSAGEARRALGEMEIKVGPKHAEEIRDKLAQAQREAAAAARAASKAAEEAAARVAEEAAKAQAAAIPADAAVSSPT